MQTEYIGRGSLSKLSNILDKTKSKKILLVTGKKSFDLSEAKIYLDKKLSKKQVQIFNNFNTNTDFADVVKGIKIVKKFHPDLIIAIGGGSVMDMAKLINILSFQEGNSLHSLVKDSKLISTKGLSLVAIPTTSGSGSQATHFAVIYLEKYKYSVSHSYILPDYVIVDSDLTKTTPKKIAAICAMDALSQAIESLWAINSTDESRRFASESINLILRSIRLAINKKENQALAEMSLGSHLAGKAINISKTTAPHAISYILTSCYQIPHGHAVALLLAPTALISSQKHNNHKFAESFKLICKFFECNTADEFYLKWMNLMVEIGLNCKIDESLFSRKDIEFISKSVNEERLSNHPVQLKYKDILEITKMSIASKTSSLQ